MKCLRSILRLQWQDRFPNTKLLRRTKTLSIGAILMKTQMRWCGHMFRMADDRLPIAVLYSQLASGKRKAGEQHLRFKYVLKIHLSACSIRFDLRGKHTQTRSVWRSTVRTAVKQFEEGRLIVLDKNRHTYLQLCESLALSIRRRWVSQRHIRAHRREDQHDSWSSPFTMHLEDRRIMWANMWSAILVTKNMYFWTCFFFKQFSIF